MGDAVEYPEHKHRFLCLRISPAWSPAQALAGALLAETDTVEQPVLAVGLTCLARAGDSLQRGTSAVPERLQPLLPTGCAAATPTSGGSRSIPTGCAAATSLLLPGRPRGRSGGTPTRAAASLRFRSDAAQSRVQRPVCKRITVLPWPFSGVTTTLCSNDAKNPLHGGGDRSIVCGDFVSVALTRVYP